MQFVKHTNAHLRIGGRGQTTRTCFTRWRRSTVCARSEEFARLRRLVCKQRQMLVWTKVGLADMHHARGSVDAMRDRYQQQISGRARTWPEAVALFEVLCSRSSDAPDRVRPQCVIQTI